ncbi:PH, RCC1 and FYVE domains-containing protein 1-like [Cynara cardunculus var. scolymus]|uniref:PH, RCC1 and FYVE domains-containing protein 1-like n=1 Tax=Cynara cardunculus var. scolymus TaxID=59895 RepID=UPI000D624AE2|nr:PH, RCC1 and FYVE domains-containing protein 1-like [Cynara cardunculus var. scolymus]XP_024976481.1 PH, RCC1 and FYVE domains-containing protein 1-like [Cynara cardunculus var. scolymus]
MLTRRQDENYPRSLADSSRLTLPSTTSSSQGSLLDDVDSLHDVFIWGEGSGDGLLGGGVHRMGSPSSARMDALLPKALKSSMAFDARKVSCGSTHAVVVTKQRAVYSWGEGSGGRLGHGVEADVSIPKLIKELSRTNIELVACGENHTCAVTQAGHLYTWGDGIHNSGLLGHGTEASYWTPRKVGGQIEGMHISFISCGPWHSAAATSEGLLFTFGDGTFGALGHGDNSGTYCPREVEALKGLRTVKVSCGVWHTAAIVEVDHEPSTSGSSPAWKLFTWGNGDKGQLGHDDKDPRFFPSCVLSLYDKNFCQVACGHSLTVALTTSGQVYSMGSADYGQLGNPENTGNVPLCIEGKLKDSCIKEISCGSHHVAILNSKYEVYTWGKGAKGQLGHGDNKDRNIPTLLEALHETQVKSVVCGSNFTVAICLRKHVCAVDLPMCSGCHAQFNYKRKRQNCYNCGLVFCKPCSNRKSLKASLAPNMDKPCRVCEDCYYRLNKEETDMKSSYLPPKVSRTNTNHRSGPDNERKSSYHKSQSLLARLSSLDSFRLSGNQHSKPDTSQESGNSGALSLHNQSLQKEYSYASNSSPFVFDPGRIAAFLPSAIVGFQAPSPISTKPSPNHSMSFSSTTLSLALPEAKGDDSKRKNDDPKKEISTLRDQVEYLSKKAQILESELKTTSLQLKEATKQARDEGEKNKVAKVEIKSLTTQLEDLARLVGQGSSPMCRVSGSYAGKTSRTFGRASLRRQWTL